MSSCSTVSEVVEDGGNRLERWRPEAGKKRSNGGDPERLRPIPSAERKNVSRRSQRWLPIELGRPGSTAACSAATAATGSSRLDLGLGLGHLCVGKTDEGGEGE